MRPEKVRLSREPPSPALPNCIAGAVVDIAYLGDISVYKLRIRDGSIVQAAVANVGGSASAFGFDEQVSLSWPAEAAIVLTH